jgi:hypothetical protein
MEEKCWREGIQSGWVPGKKKKKVSGGNRGRK